VIIVRETYCNVILELKMRNHDNIRILTWKFIMKETKYSCIKYDVRPRFLFYLTLVQIWHYFHNFDSKELE
jgi:hypothetical protein